ncbi:uncharacterized protein DMENIID0001_022290 [Sergentomyia squamirostris]
MEQFSHDLTLALEETSRIGNLNTRWGLRRRTRSTGNLPSAPQPTEDSSSSPADGPSRRPDFGATGGTDSLANTFLSDSDDHSELKLLIKSRDVGNFESDSLNENFSPARPNTRRKRKFKRMAVEYETTPTTPGASNVNPLFPVGAIKKRVLRHVCQENFRANLYFCGKRKRSHRERCAEYDHKQHSSSVPRQRDVFIPRYSYLEFKSRSRQLGGRPFEKIQPLNKNIVSKIEKISQESSMTAAGGSQCGGMALIGRAGCSKSLVVEPPVTEDEDTMKSADRSDFPVNSHAETFVTPLQHNQMVTAVPGVQSSGHHHRRGRKKEYIKMQLQFEDPNFMDCSLSEFLSSSSLSSSDSEEAATNESDHEGDDELTDWPGNEVMINFASKNDFKRARAPKLTKTRSNHDSTSRDPDADMMSVDQSTATHSLSGRAPVSTQPINIAGGSSYSSGAGVGRPEIESEMSGETSNHFLSSPNTMGEVREIRAGCRRIREERPGFSIITSVNEDVSRFLQDGQQTELRVPDSNTKEHEKLSHLAKLYSLNMQLNDGCAVLTKTSNTTQTVRIDRGSMSNHHLLLSDSKRRCYGGDTEDVDLDEMPS